MAKENPQWRDPQESIIKGSYQPNRNGSISWIPAFAGMTGLVAVHEVQFCLLSHGLLVSCRC